MCRIMPALLSRAAEWKQYFIRELHLTAVCRELQSDIQLEKYLESPRRRISVRISIAVAE